MKTILVSGVTGIVGYGIIRSLRKENRFRLVGTSIYQNSLATAFVDVYEKAPHTDDKDYLNWLLAMINKHGIDLIIPGIEIDMYCWNMHRDIIEATGAKLMLNSTELICLCGDKWNFYQKLRESMEEFSIPTFLSSDYETLVQTLGEPFLLKPRRGFASKGIKAIYDKSDFDYYKMKYEDTVMVQKIITGEEYTIGAFFDVQSKLCANICMKRILNAGGFTETAEVVEIKGIEKILSDLADIFKPIGATNFQFKMDGDKIKLLEINPRISSSTSIRTAFDYNECCMSANFFLYNEVPIQPKILLGMASRYIEDIIKYDRCDI